jgi:hypothetical protein
MHLVYQDLKKIHKIALKNNKIEFKTKVDLFLECSKFLAKLSATEEDTLKIVDNSNTGKTAEGELLSVVDSP